MSLKHVAEALYRSRGGKVVAASKFGNRKAMVGGVRFDSKWEAERFQQLQLLVEAGAILKLERQVPFVIDVNGQHVCAYVADFTYYAPGAGGWKLVVEDAKGFKTPLYRLKKKLMLAANGIVIREVRSEVERVRKAP